VSNEKQYNKRIGQPSFGLSAFFNQRERVDGKEIRETGVGDAAAVSRGIFALFQRKSIIISETFRKFAAKKQQCEKDYARDK